MAKKQGFHGFKPNFSGYRAAQNSGAVQRILQQEADSRAGGATARTNAHGHEGTHFAVKKITGRKYGDGGYIVHPITNEGAAHAAEALGE